MSLPNKNKVFDYVVVLKLTQGPAVQRAGAILSCLTIFMMIYQWLNDPRSGALIIFAIASLVMTGWNLRQMLQQKNIRFRWVFLLAGMGLMVVPPFRLVGLILILLAWMEGFALSRTEIGFSPDAIMISGWARKTIHWSALNNVVLKDGILTMDFKDNRLYQKLTEDLEDDEYDAGEDEFNAYCKQQLHIS